MLGIWSAATSASNCALIAITANETLGDPRTAT
jgi:hypothetical protein